VITDNRPTPPTSPTQTVLNDSLKQIADGKLPVDALQCTAAYSTGLMSAQLKIGDEAPTASISISKRGVQVSKTVVTELRPVVVQQKTVASIPTFSSSAIYVEVSEAELRQLVGLVAEMGLLAGQKAFSAGNNLERRFCLAASVGDQIGSLSLDLANPDDAKRVEKLLAMFNDFRKRPEKKK
jgi:hypothetical protein